jgi:hypothetical protein
MNFDQLNQDFSSLSSHLLYPRLYSLFDTYVYARRELSLRDRRYTLSTLRVSASRYRTTVFLLAGKEREEVLDFDFTISPFMHLRVFSCKNQEFLEILASTTEGTVATTVELNYSRVTCEKLSTNVSLLKNIKYIFMGGLGINEIPEEICWNMFNLEVLMADNNRLVTIPRDLYKIRSLKIVNFSHNKILRVPDEFEMCCRLTVADFGHNRHMRIPNFFLRMMLENEKLNLILPRDDVSTRENTIPYLENLKKYREIISLIDSLIPMPIADELKPHVLEQGTEAH